MSGYLQRLALSAMKPANAIRPFRGSVFAAQNAAPVDFHEIKDEIAAPLPAPRSAVAPTGLSPRGAEERAIGDGLGQRTAADRGSPRQVSQSDMAASLKRPSLSSTPHAPQRDRSMPSNGEFDRRMAVKVDEDRSSSLMGEMERRPSLSRLREAEAFGEDAPLVKGSFDVAPIPFSPPRAPSAPASPARRREAGASQQNDEVHIHIGRIEVTAAPPAPPLRAVKPQREGPSLEAYLRRRNGRAS